MALIPKILIVGNVEANSPLWAFNFTQQRLSLVRETNPANTLQRWTESLPDLIILDIDSESEEFAIELITTLRNEAVLPILLLTSLRDEKFLLETYKAGVDECILKPISPSLFHAKVKVWLRHSWNIPLDTLDALRLGKFHLIPANRVLEVEGSDAIHLTNLELHLLYGLMGRPGQTVSTEELCQRVWRHAGEGDAATLKSLIYRLRQKIEADPANPRYILTVVGVGYQFVVKLTESKSY